MSLPADTPIRVTQTPDGVIYRLPRRDMRGSRFTPVLWTTAGLVLLIVTLIWLGYFLHVAIVTHWYTHDPMGLNDHFLLAPSSPMVMAPFMLLALYCLFCGIRALAGHSEIRLTRTHLITTERAGLIDLLRDRKPAELARLAATLRHAPRLPV